MIDVNAACLPSKRARHSTTTTTTHCWLTSVAAIDRALVVYIESLPAINMPADIRSFFGGGPPKSQGSQKKDEAPAKKAAPKKTGRASRVVMDESDDDDDDDEEVKCVSHHTRSNKFN